MKIENYRLVYCSVAKHSIGEAEDQAIVSISEKNNKKCGVRGVLLRSEMGYTQILEGSRPAVRATFLRISRDRRHHSLKIFSECWSEVVLFKTWGMKYIKVPERYLNNRSVRAKSNISSDHLSIATHCAIHANFGIAEISSHFQKMRRELSSRQEQS